MIDYWPRPSVVIHGLLIIESAHALLLGLTGTDRVGAAVAVVPVCATAGSPGPTARLTARALSGAAGSCLPSGLGGIIQAQMNVR